MDIFERKDIFEQRKADLVENPTPRVAVCLCLDTSGSMDTVEGKCVPTGETIFKDGREWMVVEGGKTRLQELQKGVQLFFDAIREDEVAVYSAEISIVTFDSQAKCILDFANMERQPKVPDLFTNGDTHMGEGVNMALDLLQRRTEEYRNAGVDYYQPWLVLMTDGVPNGDPYELERAIQRTSELVNQRKLTVFPIGIGNEKNMITILNKFSPKRQALRLQGLKFRESTPGENIKLNVDGIKGWATL